MREEELIKLARGGDNDAFRQLIVAAREPCMRLARSLLRNRENAIEELQNAFWNAYTQLHSFRQNARFSSWLGRIVINRCLVRLRQQRRTQTISYERAGSNDELYDAFEPVEVETPETRLGKAQLRGLVANELGLLPPLLRRPLELRFMHELSPDEIARELQVSVTAAKARLHRAQNYLRARMTRHCGVRGAATLTDSR